MEKREKQSTSVSLSELEDLVSRAHLIENTDSLPETKGLKVKSRVVHIGEFIAISQKLFDVVSTLGELIQMGHFTYGGSYVKTFEDMKSMKESLTAYERKLNEDLTEWREQLQQARKNYFSLNFIYYDQIRILCDFFEQKAEGKCVIPKEDVLSILRYITSDIDEKFLG